MIPILCQSCDSHIFDLDQTKLSLPLMFGMFIPVHKNNKLPSGKLHSDTYCSVCFGPWLHWNAGTGVMGEWLKVPGRDGKPVLIKTIDLIAKWVGVPQTKTTLGEVQDKARREGKEIVDLTPDRKAHAFKVKGFKNKPGRKPKRVKPSPIIDVAPPELKALVTQGQSAEPAEITKDEVLAAKREQDRERGALTRNRQLRAIRPYTGR